ncbi:MAG: class I SAM-dependent methyltransferase [Bradyrhizobium guangdongense]
MTGLAHCVVCGAVEARPVWSVDNAPLYPFRPADKAKSRFGFGKLAIVACAQCGHLYNSAFDTGGADELYSSFVLTNEPVSPSMLRAVESVAETILRHASARPSVLEVGGGGGALSLTLAPHAREVHLVEPSRAVTAERFAGTQVQFHNGMFPAAALGERKFDVIACRQVIEHVPDPAPFLTALRARMKDDGLAYLELPSAEYVVDRPSIVDLHYPHVHYYRRSEMTALLQCAGFVVRDIIDVKDGHDVAFLLGAAPRNTASPALTMREDGLSAALASAHSRGGKRLAAMAGAIALYGANAYSQALLGLYPDVTSLAGMFDDTPSYAGKSAYGAHIDLPVERPSPERLKDFAAVLITAYLHDRPIADKVRAMGFAGPILTVRADPPAGLPSLFA